jgi:hypothetical protein
MSDDPSQKALVVSQMIASLRRGEDRAYFVGLVGYFIESCPCPASGLNVDLIATPNIRQTQDGFVCDAFFPRSSLPRETVQGHGIVKKGSSGPETDLVPVTLEVKLRDVWSVAEWIEKAQHILIEDEDALISRQGPFRAEWKEWIDARKGPDDRE